MRKKYLNCKIPMNLQIFAEGGAEMVLGPKAAMAVEPEQIVIGAGTEYLYQLLIQLLGRNRIYGIENPGYQKLAQVYDRNDVQFRYLELDGEGLSLEALRRSEVQIVHTSPSTIFPRAL